MSTSSPQIDWQPHSNRKPSLQDPAKLFRQEGISITTPGFLDAKSVPDSAHLAVREGLQNSIDACTDKKFKDSVHATGACTVTYIWKEYTGKEKLDKLKDLGIDQKDMLKRSKSLNDDSDPDKVIRDEVKKLNEPTAPLVLLYIEEEHASGMYHSREKELSPSRLYAATLDVNESDKDDDSGGSYGQGKVALIAASALRLNYVYTDYRWKPDNDKKAALMGVCCWPKHSESKQDYSGYAYYADGYVCVNKEPIAPMPFYDIEAHDLAKSLGFTPRTKAGSSILIVQPTFKYTDLEKALLLNWWPALLEGTLKVQMLSGGSTKVKVLDPRSEPATVVALDRFCKAYDIMVKTPQAKEYGNLGIACVDVERDAKARSSADIAKMRKIGLVVEYQKVFAPGPKDKELCGCFMADAETGTILRKTENKGHSTWRDTGPGASAKKVREVSAHIKKAVADFAREMRGASSPESKSSSILSELLKDFMNTPGDNSGRKPKKIAPKTSNTSPAPLVSEFTECTPSVDTNANSMSLVFSLKEDSKGKVNLFYVADGAAIGVNDALLDVAIYQHVLGNTLVRMTPIGGSYTFVAGTKYTAQTTDECMSAVKQICDENLDVSWRLEIV